MSLFLAVWIALESLQQPRQEVAVAAVNGLVYVLGGIGATAALASVEEYDPRTNQWRFVAPMPETLHHQAAAVVDDMLYVIGGYRTLAFDATDSVYRYDLRTNSWTRVASLPAPRAALAAVTIDGLIYAVGGVPGGRALHSYNPRTDQWTALAPMPTAREHLAAAAIGGKLYVAGGRFPANLDAFEVYDPVTNRWTTLPPLPTARGGLGAAAVGSRIYVFGGEGNGASPTGVFAENESYDVETNTWRTELPMPTPRHGIGAAVIDGRIYLPGGATLQGFGAVSAHDAFVPSGPARRRIVQPR